MPNYVAKKTAGASAQLVNQWVYPIVDTTPKRPLSVSCKYLRTASYVGSFRAGFQCLDQAGAVLATVWGPTVDNASGVTDTTWQNYEAMNLDATTGTFGVRMLVEVGVSGSTAHSAGEIRFDTMDVTQSVVASIDFIRDGSSYGRIKTAFLTAGDLTSIFRAGAIVPTTDMFKKSGAGYDTLDVIADGSSYRRVSNSYIDTLNRITYVHRSGADVPTSDLFKHSGAGANTLDNITDGATYGKVLGSYLSAGAVDKLKRGVGTISGDDVFELGVDTLDSVQDGTTYKRLNADQVTDNRLADSIVSLANLNSLLITDGPPNGNFGLTGPNQTGGRPDGWAEVTGGTWGSSLDIFHGTSTVNGKYIEFRQTAANPVLRSRAWSLKRGATHGVLSLVQRPNGTLTGGFNVKITFFAEETLVTSTGNVEITIPTTVPNETWSEYTETIAIPAGSNYAYCELFKDLASSSYGWYVAEVSFAPEFKLAKVPWTAVTGGVGYGTNFAGSFGGSDDAKWRVKRGSRIELGGWASRSTGTNTLVFTLPTGARPDVRKYILHGYYDTTAATYKACRVDVDVDGRVLLLGTASGACDVCFDGIEVDLA